MIECFASIVPRLALENDVFPVRILLCFAVHLNNGSKQITLLQIVSTNQKP